MVPRIGPSNLIFPCDGSFASHLMVVNLWDSVLWRLVPFEGARRRTDLVLCARNVSRRSHWTKVECISPSHSSFNSETGVHHVSNSVSFSGEQPRMDKEFQRRGMSARRRRPSGGTTIHEACTRRYCLRLGPGRCLRGMVGLLGQTQMCRPSPAARLLCVTPRETDCHVPLWGWGGIPLVPAHMCSCFGAALRRHRGDEVGPPWIDDYVRLAVVPEVGLRRLLSLCNFSLVHHVSNSVSFRGEQPRMD